MSNYKLKLNQVREILNLKIAFEAAKLQDGTVIEYEKLEPGFLVEIVAEDGTKTPAPAGYHVLEDGVTKIEVDAAGLIMEISNEAEEAEVEEGEVVEVAGAIEEEVKIEEKMPEAMAEVIKEKVAEVIEEKMKMAFEAITEVADEVAKVKEEMAAFSAKFNKFSKAPAAGAPAKVTEAISERLSAVETKAAFLKGIMSAK